MRYYKKCFGMINMDLSHEAADYAAANPAHPVVLSFLL